MAQKKGVMAIVGKLPVKGLAKTRLGREIGDELAISFYRCFLEDFFGGIGPHTEGMTVYFFGTPAQEETKFFFEELLTRKGVQDFSIEFQGEGDLFSRLECVFDHIEKELGEVGVLLTGTDIPDFPLAILEHCRALDPKKEVFIGPDTDGGFYCVYTSAKNGKIFALDRRDAEEGRSRVLQTIVRKCHSLGLTTKLYPLWSDIDDSSGLTEFIGRQKDRNSAKTCQLYQKQFQKVQ